MLKKREKKPSAAAAAAAATGCNAGSGGGCTGARGVSALRGGRGWDSSTIGAG